MRLLLVFQIGEDIVGPGFSDQLERFYKKAKPADRARCLELLTAINIQREVKSRLANQRPVSRAQTPAPNSFRATSPLPQRPYTAMAATTQGNNTKHRQIL